MVPYLWSRLATMMFLQYFAVGAWLVPLAKFLGKPASAGGMAFNPPEIAGIYSTFALGGLIAPLFVGLLADRFFAAEKVLGSLHVLMAAFLTGAGFWAAEFDGADANPERAFWPLFALMLGYNICCLASMTLTNVIGFRNLADPRTSFGYVRLVGTLGWIVSGIVLAFAMNPVSAEPLFLGAGASVLLALASRWLPHTPPKGQGRPIAEVVGLPAIQLLRKPIFIAFAIVAFACNALNQFYAVYINPYFDDLAIWKPEAVLTLAQWAEIVCMAISPWLVMRWGLKWVMLLGLCGWTVRNALLYLGDVPSIIAVAVPMHGVGFALFGMLGSIFVDREAPPHLRAGAQALVMLLTNGPALLLGNYAAGQIVQSHQLASVISWPGVWFVSVIGYALATLFFFVFFRETERNKVGNANSPRE